MSDNNIYDDKKYKWWHCLASTVSFLFFFFGIRWSIIASLCRLIEMTIGYPADNATKRKAPGKKNTASF